jgi:mannose-6-phosphate isomerase-like protein (cupin superfamily)
MDPIVFGENDGEIYDTGAVRLRLLAQSPDHPIAITDSTVPPGFPGPVRHRHAQMIDIFYVLEGELTFDLAGEQRALGTGGFVLVPPGVVHTFANRGSVPARVLNILQPSGLEQYLKEAFKRMAGAIPGHHQKWPRLPPGTTSSRWRRTGKSQFWPNFWCIPCLSTALGAWAAG